MKALHRMDRYRKEVLQLSTRKHGINVQYLYDMLLPSLVVFEHPLGRIISMFILCLVKGRAVFKTPTNMENNLKSDLELMPWTPE